MRFHHVVQIICHRGSLSSVSIPRLPFLAEPLQLNPAFCLRLQMWPIGLM